MKRLLAAVALLALLLPAALLAQDGGLTLERLAAQIERLFADQGELAARVAALETRVPPPLPSRHTAQTDGHSPPPGDGAPLPPTPTPQTGPTGPPPADGAQQQQPTPTPQTAPTGPPPADLGPEPAHEPAPHATPPPAHEPTPHATPGTGLAPTPVQPKPLDDPPTLLQVTADRANVYAGPGSHHDIIETVTKGDTFPGPLTQVNGWYYFCCLAHELSGWIARPLVTLLNTDQVPAWQAARSAAVELELDALLRYNEDYLGKKVYFSDVQVLHAMDSALLVVIPAGGWVESAWLLYENSAPRVLARDRIEFVAQVEGLHRLDTTFGVSVTMPLLRVVALRMVE